MGIPGCKSCGESLQAEAEAKKESGEELTDHEQEVLNAEDPNDVVPQLFGLPAYGRLSEYNGQHCTFCEGVGYILAFVFTALLSTLLPFQGQTLTMALGFVLLLQLVMVAFYGRYLLIGSVAGPIVERIFAQFGVFLTAKSEREYNQQTATDGGTAVETESDVDWDIKTDPDAEKEDLPDGYFDAQEDRFREQLNHYKAKLESLQESLSQERGEKMELKSELEETQNQINKIQQKKEQHQEQLEEVEEQVEKKQEQIKHLSDFGKDRESQNRIPIWVHDQNGVKVGPFWYIKTVEVHLERDDYYGSAKFAFVVDSQGASVPNHIPDTLDESDLKRYEDHLRPHPDKVLNPPEFEHFGEPGYPNVNIRDQPLEEYPRVLFHENKARVTDARQRIDDTTTEGEIKHAALTLAYDTGGNYVAPSYDSRGFGSREEKRNQARKRYRQMQSLMSKLDQKDDFVEDLQHRIKILEEQLNIKDGFLDEARQQSQKATKAAMVTEHQTEQARRGQEFLKHQNQSHKEIAEAANEQVRNERRKRIEDNEDFEETVREYDNINNRKETVDRVFQGVWGTGWNRPTDPFDYEAIRSGDSNHKKEDVIRAFREEADEDKYRNLVKTIDNELTGMFQGGEGK